MEDSPTAIVFDMATVLLAMGCLILGMLIGLARR